MFELEFYGAAGEVTGSCHVLRIGERQVLLDCGMIQGGRDADARNAQPFPFDASNIDAVVLSIYNRLQSERSGPPALR